MEPDSPQRRLAAVVSVRRDEPYCLILRDETGARAMASAHLLAHAYALWRAAR